jgi:hypothetical protein
VAGLWLVLAAAATASGEAVFSEQSIALGVDFRHFSGATGEYYFPEINGAGSALLDYDNDGDLDLYLVQGALLDPAASLDEALFPPKSGEPVCDQLYRNDLFHDAMGSQRQRFVRVTPDSGIEGCGYGTGVTVGDYDADGWDDLYVSHFGPNRLWRNRGDGTFEDVTAAAGTEEDRWSTAAAFFDYDRDGLLDLYVGNYADFRVASRRRCFAQAGYPDYCGPKSYQPEPDRLFRNRGDGTFEETTLKAWTSEDYGYALGSIPADFDGDGWLDLYVANDQVPNQLWINQRDGTFRNDALLGGCAVNSQGQPEASMGVDAGDFDRDGDLDLFMTHVVNETNTLFVNDGTALFEDRSVASGLGAASWRATGFGAAFLDYDNDGWLDLLAVNGGVTIQEELVGQGDPFPFGQRNLLFRNLGNGRFADVSGDGGPAFESTHVGRGAAFGDLDNDGDVDIVILNDSGPVEILINEVGNRNAWAGLRLLGGPGGRDQLGAMVGAIPADGAPLWRLVRAAGSYASANDTRVLLGLGQGGVTRFDVRWLDGRASSWRDLPDRRYVILRQRPGPPTASERARE